MRKTILLFIALIGMALPSFAALNASKMSKAVLGDTKDTVVVSTVDSLKLAMSGATKDRLILLRKCSDVAGYYALGSTGLSYAPTFINLEIKNYPGDTAKMFGSFTSAAAARMKLKSFTVDGLWFQQVLAIDAEAMTPFYFLGADTIKTGLYVKNCTFKDLGGASKARLFYVKAAGVNVNEVIFEGNTIDNFGDGTADGAHGQTMFQFANFSYTCDSLVVRNNLIRDYHGNQFINNSRQQMTSSLDSAMYIVVEGNSFIRFGGNGTSNRNFVEWTNKMVKVKGYVTIKNNLFYKNWSAVNKKCFQLALYNRDTLNKQVLEVKVLNNYFEPADVVMDLPITNATLAPTVLERKNFTKESFGIAKTFNDETALVISNKSPLFTASTTNGPIGLASMYQNVALPERPCQTVQVNSLLGLKNSITSAVDGDTIELLNCTDAIGYYKLGTTGLTYPSKFVSLTVRPAAASTPLVYGSFGSTGTPRMKLKSLTFNGVTFKGDLSDLAENNQCFYLQANDSILNGLYYNNCTFQDLGGAATGPRIFYAKSCANALLKALVYDGCKFKNYGGAVLDGATGQHFLHLNDAKYICDSVVLKNSIISDWHGSQFINIGRSSTNNKDSLFNLVVENNTFVRFGGNATSLRNFVECTKSFGGGDVNITIKNNLFYKRWGKNKAVAQLALFTPIAGQDLKVNVLNNFFDPDTVVVSLPVSAGAPSLLNRVSLYKANFGMATPTFINDSALIMSKKSPLFTAGTTGGPIGAPSMYTDTTIVVRTAPAVVQVNNLVALKAAIKDAFDGDQIELMNCIDALGYYKLGTTGLTYPSKFVSLTFRPAAGNTPLLYGSFGSTGTPRMKIKTMTFNNLTFKGDLTDLAENNQCFYLQANDSIVKGLYYTNCTFQDLGGAATGPRIFYAKSSANAILKALVYDGCKFKNYGGAVLDGATGQHFLHFNDAKYICDSVVLKNSVISDWHGSQFINIGRSSTNNLDSLFNLIVENNTFVRFGGNATSLRNFVECTKSFGGGDVNITIKNNLFYKRWGKNKAVAQLALFTPIAGQTLNVNVLNNYFDPDTVVVSLPVSAGAPTVLNRVNLTKSSLDMLWIPTFVNDSLLIMSRKSKLYTAGTTGGCVGAPSLYTSDSVQVVAVKKVSSTSKLNAYSNGNILYVNGIDKPVVLFNMLGQKIGTFTPEEAERGVAIRTKGLVLVTSDGSTLRMMVR